MTSETALRYKMEYPAVKPDARSHLRIAQVPLVLGILKKAILPIIDDACVVEEDDRVLVQGLTDIRPDPLQPGENEIGPDPEEPFDTNISDLSLCARDSVLDDANLSDREVFAKTGLILLCFIYVNQHPLSAGSRPVSCPT